MSTNIQCGDIRAPSCTLSASSSGQPATVSSSPTVQQVSATKTGSNQCQAPNDVGTLVPCNDSTFGWLGSTGCYYKADPGFQPPASDTVDQAPAGQAGAYYTVTCSPQNLSTGGGIVWIPAGPAGAAVVLPNPAVLAQQAVSQLAVPSLQIDASPAVGADQLVGLPTWLWLEPEGWHPITATAAVPGESVTATASPTSVTWNFGDGNSMVCQGPGTPYTLADASDASSPTCGYTYHTSSAGQPNDTFAVTATVSWSVSWAGGGQTGTVPALENTASTDLRVAEVESLNTTGQEA